MKTEQTTEDKIKKIKQTISTCISDREWVGRFEDQLRMLCGMVEEMFVENKAYLLSPIFREMIRDKARDVEKMRMVVRGRICVDNLGAPL